MNALIPSPELLLLLGPGVLALMAWLETSLPVGLMVPAGVALALGAFLARDGFFPLPTVIMAAGFGGIAGDWTGYWLGRYRTTSVFHRAPGFVGRLARKYEVPTARVIQRRPFWSVTLGRTVSFVRTLMPAAVGRSGMTFPRFVAYDLLGVAAWLTLYTSVGLLAGASWQAASGMIGTGWALLFLLGGVSVVVVNRVRAAREAGAEETPGDTDVSMPLPLPGLLQVGLTGNVASGKSTVARQWAAAGVPVVSADDLAREAVVPGSEGLAAVLEAFGDGMLDSAGELDRPKLRAAIFADADARARLEGILHPRIARLRSDWVADRTREGHRLVVSEIPLLFEAGLEGAVDRIVFVDAPREERRRRLVDGRGIDPDEADRILDAQGDPEDKRPRSDHVIENAGSLAALEARADQVLADLRQEAGE